MHPLTFIYLWYLCIYYIWYIETIFVQTKKARKKINQKPPNWKRSQRSVHPCSRSRGRRGWWRHSMAPFKNPCPSSGPWSVTRVAGQFRRYHRWTQRQIESSKLRSNQLDDFILIFLIFRPKRTTGLEIAAWSRWSRGVQFLDSNVEALPAAPKVQNSANSLSGGMSSSHRYFEGKSHAAIYAAYRPTPPTSLVEKIVNNIR